MGLPQIWISSSDPIPWNRDSQGHRVFRSTVDRQEQESGTDIRDKPEECLQSVAIATCRDDEGCGNMPMVLLEFQIFYDAVGERPIGGVASSLIYSARWVS